MYNILLQSTFTNTYPKMRDLWTPPPALHTKVYGIINECPRQSLKYWDEAACQAIFEP